MSTETGPRIHRGDIEQAFTGAGLAARKVLIVTQTGVWDNVWPMVALPLRSCFGL
jgi:hypothetical protein